MIRAVCYGTIACIVFLFIAMTITTFVVKAVFAVGSFFFTVIVGFLGICAILLCFNYLFK